MTRRGPDEEGDDGNLYEGAARVALKTSYNYTSSSSS